MAPSVPFVTFSGVTSQPFVAEWFDHALSCQIARRRSFQLLQKCYTCAAGIPALLCPVALSGRSGGWEGVQHLNEPVIQRPVPLIAAAGQLNQRTSTLIDGNRARSKVWRCF